MGGRGGPEAAAKTQASKQVLGAGLGRKGGGGKGKTTLKARRR